ncbi:HNH endonuclease, partial [Murinocardiopsis flavida]
MNDKPAASHPTPGPLPRVRALLAEAEHLLRGELDTPIPPGAAPAIADEITATLGGIGRIQSATARLAERARTNAGMASSGFKNLADWMSCANGLTRAEGAHYALLGQPPEGMDATTRAVDQQHITASKAARIAYWIKRCATHRDRAAHPTETHFTTAAQDVLLPLAARRDTTCRDLDLAGRGLYATLHPYEHDKTERDLHDQRGASLFHDRDRGGFHFSMQGSSADYDRLRTALDAFTAPPEPGDTRSASQRRYDAAMEMVDFALSHSGDLPWRGGEPAQVRLTMGLDTLRGEPGAPPATSDHGTVYPLSAARLAAKDAKVRPIITDPVTGTPLDVGRSQRICPPRLRNAVMARYSSCAWEDGCDRPIAWCQVDHKTAWWDGGATDLDNLQPLCAAHNLAKEHRRAAHERRTRTHR